MASGPDPSFAEASGFHQLIGPGHEGIQTLHGIANIYHYIKEFAAFRVVKDNGHSGSSGMEGYPNPISLGTERPIGVTWRTLGRSKYQGLVGTKDIQ